MTALGAGFNAVEDEPASDTTTQETLEHLAAATAADRTAVANLTSANEKLSQELKNKNNALQQLQRSFDQLQSQLNAL